MTRLWLENLLSYSAQIAILLAAGSIAIRLLLHRLPPARLICWQALLGLCLLLAVAEPWTPIGGGSVQISMETRGFAKPIQRRPFGWTGWRQTLAALLIAGTVFRLGRFGLGLVQLAGYRRRSRMWPDAAIEEQRQLGVQAAIATSDEIPGPVTFGVLHPVVLLPTRWLDSKPVLYHELIHVRRRDWAAMAVEELVRALLWFHPLVWYAIAQIQLAREEVVDREVVKFTQSREQYLETLLAIAAARSGLDLAPAPLFLKKRHLRSRVASLMKEVRMSKFRLHSSLVGLLAVTLSAGWLAVRAFPLKAQSSTAQESTKPAGKPKLVYKAPIDYPAELKGSGLAGTVTVRIEIDKEGSVSQAYVIGGPNEFRDAALSSIRQWRFSTDAELPTQATIEVRFRDGADVADAQSDPAVKRLRIGGNVQSTRLIKKITPVYPPEAKAEHIQGKVRLNVLIGADGAVKDVEVESGDPTLTDAAVTAVRQWVYSTTLLNGEPVEVSTVVDVNFTLLQ